MQQTYDYLLSKREEIVPFVRAQLFIASVTFVGCGSSYCLSESAAISVCLRAGLQSISLAGGDLMLHHLRYRSLVEDTLLIAPSCSGSTSEVVDIVLFRPLQTVAYLPYFLLACMAAVLL